MKLRKRWWLAGGAAVVAGGAIAAAGVRTASPQPPGIGGDRERVSYSMGVALGRSFKRPGLELDAAALARGVRAGLGGDAPALSDEELRKSLQGFQAELRLRELEAVKRSGEQNQRQGEAFLAANGKRKGVVTLPSGLQYEVIREGAGARPGEADTVECRYRAARLDGSEFDSTKARGRASSSFPVARVIPGWKEALKLMPIGSHWRLYVPPALAYGERGLHGKRGHGLEVGPNATLVFDIELLGIHAKQGVAEGPVAVPTSAEEE
jgi:FKBP-type peptidyl-prolyl cis-trans isomerase